MARRSLWITGRAFVDPLAARLLHLPWPASPAALEMRRGRNVKRGIRGRRRRKNRELRGAALSRRRAAATPRHCNAAPLGRRAVSPPRRYFRAPPAGAGRYRTRRRQCHKMASRGPRGRARGIHQKPPDCRNTATDGLGRAQKARSRLSNHAPFRLWSTGGDVAIKRRVGTALSNRLAGPRCTGTPAQEAAGGPTRPKRPPRQFQKALSDYPRIPGVRRRLKDAPKTK